MTEGENEFELMECPTCESRYPSTLTKCILDASPLVSLGPIQESDALIATKLNGRYRVEKLIHRGVNSKIYKGRHELLERDVAIKVLATYLVADNVSTKRFQHEFEVAKHLSHPVFPVALDIGFCDDDVIFGVSDFIEGKTLFATVEKDGPLTVERCRLLFFKLARAMAYAHGRGVVHADLKPSHVVLSVCRPDSEWLGNNCPIALKAGDELPVILDFRLARLGPASGKTMASELQQIGEVVGTPYYMSPEQTMAQRLDERTDVYSLGCMMYFALTGRVPFSGTSIIDTMQMHMSQQPDESRLPVELRDVVLQAMAKKPEARIQSMEELARLLSANSGSKSSPSTDKKSWWRR